MARARGYSFNAKTYSPQVTENHLRTMHGREFSEQSPDGRWRLSGLARQRINQSGRPSG
jgi:hypothetical protein